MVFRFACVIATVVFLAGCKNNSVSSSNVKEVPAACQALEKKVVDLKAELTSLTTDKPKDSSTTPSTTAVTRPGVISESECSKGDGNLRGDQCTCDSGEVMEPAKGEFCNNGQWVEGVTGLPTGGYFNRKTCLQNSGEYQVDKNACKCAKGELIYNTFDMRQWCASGRPAATTANSKPAALGLTGDTDESMDLEPDFDDPVGFGLTAPRTEEIVLRELEEASALLTTCITKNTAASTAGVTGSCVVYEKTTNIVQATCFSAQDQNGCDANFATVYEKVAPGKYGKELVKDVGCSEAKTIVAAKLKDQPDGVSATQTKCLCTVFRQKVPQTDKVNRLCLVARKGDNSAWKVIRRLPDDVDCKSQCDSTGGDAVKDMKSAACTK